MAVIGKEWEASLQKQNRKTNPFLTQTLYTLSPSQRTLRGSEVYREWQASEYTGHRQLLRGRNIRCHETSLQCNFQFSSVAQLWHHGLQHTRLHCPSPTPRACSNSCPSSQWCHPTISSSAIPFSSCFQSFPASGSFQMSQLFAQVAKVLEFQLQH